MSRSGLRRDYDRLLMGGIWAQVDIRHQYDEEAKGKRARSGSKELTPIQLATFDLEGLRDGRAQFTTDEWMDALLRSIGLEPAQFQPAAQAAVPGRLIPLCEPNYNLVELGPRGTGKSYAYQEIESLRHPADRADDRGQPVLQHGARQDRPGRILGCGRLRRGGRPAEDAEGGRHHAEDLLRVGHLCPWQGGAYRHGLHRHVRQHQPAGGGHGADIAPVRPMPDVIREDMAFLDRIHFYLPGWEIPKMRIEFFTDHYGFVVDYLAEALRELRKHNFTEIIDRHFSLGAHLNARDVKAVRKTVSGLVKLVYPHGEYHARRSWPSCLRWPWKAGAG